MYCSYCCCCHRLSFGPRPSQTTITIMYSTPFYISLLSFGLAVQSVLLFFFHNSNQELISFISYEGWLVLGVTNRKCRAGITLFSFVLISIPSYNCTYLYSYLVSYLFCMILLHSHILQILLRLTDWQIASHTRQTANQSEPVPLAVILPSETSSLKPILSSKLTPRRCN